MKIRSGDLLLIIIGAVIFMLFALYNGFPIVMHGDTSVYLTSGFEFRVPHERPIFYGLFIWLFSFGFTIWPAIFFQCLLLSYLCVRFIRSIVPTINNQHLVALIILVALATISSWYAGQIMPDIFTPILFLSTYIYLTQDNTRSEKIILVAIILLATLVHNSHYVISTAFILLIIGLSLTKQYRLTSIKQKCFTLILANLIAWSCLLSSNYFAGNGFVSARASHVFLMGKLAESGVLKTYLEKACPTRQYKICQYKDNIPPVAWEFVWDTEKSPVFKVGGWDSTKSEYNTIINDILSRPKYWPFLVYKSVEATMRQVILLNIDEAEELPWRKFDRESDMYVTIAKYYPHEINEFEVSRQNYKTFNLPFYDHVYVIVILLSSIVCLLITKGEERKKVWAVYWLVLAYIFINAFVTATFGNVLSRLNSRTIWLLPMTNIIFIYRYYSNKLSNSMQ